ncbi:MAG: dephospho-CoA kinase [Comamonadaceae bacterium CG1_02_60_18]|nr:MAG: dephospho-CoA kinase [Comamonadaceae bacterium CG1_02_60_18]PIQ53818.1 MAG: dephospho-CoA kinase [Comamonadaceae bacterium CG12_big_fil_rev_8_21_14_0_65_59_15]
MRLGLTGGIGSGKSTVAVMLQNLGAAIIDADAISRALTAPGGAAIADIRQTFGADFTDASGGLDRARMRALAYAQPDARQRLEAIIHPLVGKHTWQQAADYEAAGYQHLVFDVPLLVESAHWRQRVHGVVVIDCSPETQITRVMARSALSRAQVQDILAVQANRLHRLRAADAVICNDGITLEDLSRQVRALAARFGLSSPHLPVTGKPA